MRRRTTAIALGLALVLALPRVAGAQLMAGFGPAFPTGGLNNARSASTGLAASARFGMTAALVSIQIEGTYTRFTVGDLQDAPSRPLRRYGFGPTVQVHAIRVGPVRPYALAGVSFGPRTVGSGETETSWRFGTHIGGGVDFAAGPLRPFVEFRYQSSDAPGHIRDTSVPVLFGLRMF